jgi:regulator of cell morphogenesis and NO signaling
MAPKETTYLLPVKPPTAPTTARSTNMTALTETATVGQLVTQKPGRAHIFEGFGIDYCCGGGRPLGDACRERGLDPGVVIAALRAADGDSSSASDRDWSQASSGDLIEHIVSTHHVYLRRELPRLAELLAKTEQAHGARHGELAECRRVFTALRTELESHMLKEEQILFPAIRNMESAAPGQATFVGSVQGPIHAMEQEHESAGQALQTLRALTHDFTPPADACNTWRAMLDGLQTLEADLHQHIHKENNILFPRAIGLEGKHARPASSDQP